MKVFFIKGKILQLYLHMDLVKDNNNKLFYVIYERGIIE